MARSVGQTSKNKDRLWKALRAEYGENFDPIIQMAKNCSRLQIDLDKMYADGKEILEDDEHVDTISRVKLSEITNNSWDKVAAYVQPKLKAVEVEVSGSLTVSDMSNDELEARLKELADS